MKLSKWNKSEKIEVVITFDGRIYIEWKMGIMLLLSIICESFIYEKNMKLGLF